MGTISFWQHRNAGPVQSTDVAVVGGGIVGASTAYWLGQLRPSLRVALVDAGALASGASGRNAGFLLQGSASDYASDIERYGNDVAAYLWRISGENRAWVERAFDGERFDLARTGSLTVAGTPDEAERLLRSANLLREQGEPVQFLDADALHRRIQANGFYGGMYVPTGGTVDSVRLVRAIAGASGANLLEHRRVVRADWDGSRVSLETPGGRIEAGQTVFALNAYGPGLFPWMSAYVRPVRAQMLATAPVPVWLNEPVYSHEGFYYIRQMPDGRLLVGGARHLFADVEVGLEDAVTPALQQALVAYVEAHFPVAGALRVERPWSGTMGFSPDHLPVIGAVPDMPGSFWAGGLTGHGMGYGFRIGRMLAERVLGLPADAEDRYFDARRFEGG
ncbi:MAG: FAD-binding oxidoreductase [Rhodothermales bacterium]